MRQCENKKREESRRIILEEEGQGYKYANKLFIPIKTIFMIGTIII